MRPIKLRTKPLRKVLAVDTLVAGDVLRIVLDGLPDLRAASPLEALQELRDEHEEFRRFLVEPPRGHEGISACLLLPPFSPDAVRTVVVAPQIGYVPFAGTPMMAAAAALMETGAIDAREPETSVLFDTARGKAEIVLSVEDGRCVSTKWKTPHPRVVAHDRVFSLDDGRSFPATVVSLGLPYAIVRAADIGVDFRAASALSKAGAMVSRVVGRQLPLEDVGLSEDASAYAVMIVGELVLDPAQNGARNGAEATVAWVSPTGWVAATPAGTGALSVAAYFAARGELPPGTTLKTVSPSGNSLCCWRDANSASVVAPVRILSLLELVDRI